MKTLLIIIIICLLSTISFATKRVGIIGASYSNGDNKYTNDSVNNGEYFSLGEMLLKQSNYFVKNKAVAGETPADLTKQLGELVIALLDSDGNIHVDYLVIDISNGCVWGGCSDQQINNEINYIQWLAQITSEHGVYPIILGYPNISIADSYFVFRYDEEMAYYFSINNGSFVNIYSENTDADTVDGIHPKTTTMSIAATKLVEVINNN